jgi:hypothetical protein
MARPRTIWYRASRHAYYIKIDGVQMKLVKGDDDAPTRKLAELEFHKRMAAHLANPPVDGGNPTVASVIDAFLVQDEKHTCDRFFKDRKHTLQIFAEAHGYRLIRECTVYHLTSFLDAHPTASALGLLTLKQ